MRRPPNTASVQRFIAGLVVTLEVSCSAGGGVQRQSLPPPKKWAMVPHDLFVQARMVGDGHVEPDATTRDEAAKTGRHPSGTFRVCLDDRGAIVFARAVIETGIPSYDHKIIDEIRRWKFRPYVIDGKPSTVCSDVIVTYQSPPTAPPAAAPPAPAIADPAPPASESAAGANPFESTSDDETMLNSKRWVYASYFNRLKRAVAMNWAPQSVWRALGSQRTAALGAASRSTAVEVALQPDGQLIDVVIITPSGVTELDREALRACRAAAPFSNPPQDLVKDGRFRFRFSFHFDVSQGRGSLPWRLP